LGDRYALSRFRQIGQPLAALFIDHHRPDRDRQNHVPAGMPRAIRAFAVPSTIGAEFAIETVAQQRVIVLRRFQNHAPARTAVSARRPATRHEFLAPKRHAAVPAGACFDVNLGFIDKHDFIILSSLKSIRHWRGELNSGFAVPF
jgi:hypothetical protein